MLLDLMLPGADPRVGLGKEGTGLFMHEEKPERNDS